MAQDNLGSFVGLSILFAIIICLFMVAYEDGVAFSLTKKLLCKLGKHKVHHKIGKLKVHKYYCQNCKSPRKHPQLKAIDGGRKLGNTWFKF